MAIVDNILHVIAIRNEIFIKISFDSGADPGGGGFQCKYYRDNNIKFYFLNSHKNCPQNEIPCFDLS